MNNLKKIKTEFTIEKKEEISKFSINDSKNNKINFYDDKLIEISICKIIDKKYKKLLLIVNDILNSDDSTDSDIEIVLLKIEDLRKLLINYYSKYISRTLLNKYLKMILILEQKINVPVKGKSR